MSLLVKELIPSMRAPPSCPITSQSPHLQISLWELEFQHMNLGKQKHSFHSRWHLALWAKQMIKLILGLLRAFLWIYLRLLCWDSPGCNFYDSRFFLLLLSTPILTTLPWFSCHLLYTDSAVGVPLYLPSVPSVLRDQNAGEKENT